MPRRPPSLSSRACSNRGPPHVRERWVSESAGASAMRAFWVWSWSYTAEGGHFAASRRHAVQSLGQTGVIPRERHVSIHSDLPLIKP